MTCYLLRAGDTSNVKIGWAIDAQARRRELQAGCWLPLVPMRTWEGGRPTEMWLHNHFAHLRIVREWFRFDPEMLTVEPPQPTSPVIRDFGRDVLSPQDVEAKARAAGLSITDVCKRADIAQSTFSRWKAGKTSPTLTIYQRIEAALLPQAAV